MFCVLMTVCWWVLHSRDAGDALYGPERLACRAARMLQCRQNFRADCCCTGRSPGGIGAAYGWCLWRCGARMACGGLEISTSMITSCPCGFFLSVGHWHGSIVAVVTTAHVSRFRLGGVAVCWVEACSVRSRCCCPYKLLLDALRHGTLPVGWLGAA